MAPGPIESGEKVVTSFIDGMKAQPATLALAVFNIVFLIITYYLVKDQRQSNEEFRIAMMAQQKETMQMLYNCTPNKPGGTQ